MKIILKFFNQWLNKPAQVLIVCGAVIFYSLVLDGTLFQIRKLYLNQKSLDKKNYEIQAKNKVLLEKLEKLSNLRQIEKEVRNRFDLAGDGDLIFIFPEDE